MFLSLILSVLLSAPAPLAVDSTVYINGKGVVAYKGMIPTVANPKELISKIKKSGAKIDGGLIFRWDGEDCIKILNASAKMMQDSCYSAFKLIGKQLLAVNKNQQWQLLHLTGRPVTTYKYADITFTDGVLLGKDLNTIEFRNEDLSLDKQFSFESARFANSRLLIFQSGGYYGLYDLKNKFELIKAEYDMLSSFNDSLWIATKDKKSGLINSRNKIIIPVEYSHIQKDTLDMIKVKNVSVIQRKEIKNLQLVDEKFGIYNTVGKMLVPVSYNEIGHYNNGSFPVRKDELWGLVNLKGQEIISFFYKSIGKSAFGIAPAGKGFYYGIIDNKGSWVVLPEFSSLTAINDTVWLWEKRGHAGFYYPKTRKYDDVTYEELRPLEGGYYRFLQNERYGLLSPQRKVLLRPEWTSMKVYMAEQIIVGGKLNYYSIFYLNGNLKVYMNYPFTRFEPYSNGMALVVQKEKCGFIDKDGLLLVSTQYDDARHFVNGMAMIKINQKWGMVDRNEKLVVSPNYDEILDYNGFSAAVKKKGTWGFVDKTGRETIHPQYEEVKQTESGSYIVKSKGRYGIVNKYGEETINPVYRDCEPLTEYLVKVRSHSKYGVVDIYNKPLLPQIYDELSFDKKISKLSCLVKGDWKKINLTGSLPR